MMWKTIASNVLAGVITAFLLFLFSMLFGALKNINEIPKLIDEFDKINSVIANPATNPNFIDTITKSIDLKGVKGERGEPGKDADSVEVAGLLKSDSSFRRLVKGDRGIQGSVGPAGPQGPKGPQGSPGLQGPPGETPAFGHTQKFGFDVPHQAKSDGFVTVLGHCPSTGYATIKAYTDANPDPITLVAAEILGGTNWRDFGSYTFPVKKNNWWKVVTFGPSLPCQTSAILWTPIR